MKKLSLETSSRVSAALVLMLLFAAPSFAAESKWELDKAHSHIGFSVKHLGITNVRGHFEDFDATITADPKTGKVTSLEAVVQAKSIDTGIKGRDEHLRGDDFFNAAKFPTLKIASKKVTWKGKKFRAIANVTIRGKTKQVLFTGSLIGVQKTNFGAEQLRAGYEATATINRQDFGLSFNRVAEGVSVVSDEVKITLEVQTAIEVGQQHVSAD